MLLITVIKRLSIICDRLQLESNLPNITGYSFKKVICNGLHLGLNLPNPGLYTVEAVVTYDAQQPHLGEAGGGVVGAVVELGHLVVLPGFKAV